MGDPLVVRTSAEMTAWSNAAHARGQRIAFVPTMGALHEGHVTLLRDGRRRAEKLVLSIFVNPTQFGPNEDLARYPRDLAGDLAKAAAAGTDVAFVPEVAEIYPLGFQTTVQVGELSRGLDGPFRPGHFAGVATVVAKLFAAAEPDLAFFGQKDAAQVAVLRRMTTDLRLATEIVVCPIAREPDGLALSSRNVYLNPAQRMQALALSRAIGAVESLVGHGQRSAAVLIEAAQAVFGAEPDLRVDYIALVDWATLQPVESAAPGTLFAVAAWVGETRLIDNTILS